VVDAWTTRSQNGPAGCQRWASVSSTGADPTVLLHLLVSAAESESVNRHARCSPTCGRRRQLLHRLEVVAGHP
jgi:hypothetical protein